MHLPPSSWWVGAIISQPLNPITCVLLEIKLCVVISLYCSAESSWKKQRNRIGCKTLKRFSWISLEVYKTARRRRSLLSSKAPIPPPPKVLWLNEHFGPNSLRTLPKPGPCVRHVLVRAGHSSRLHKTIMFNERKGREVHREEEIHYLVGC